MSGLSPAQANASDPQRSAWVSASAGTGKTHMLTARMLRLLLAGADPAKILCLTYTKAAAAEMTQRLQQRLAKWSALDDEALREDLGDVLGHAPEAASLAQARRLFAESLDVPGGMAIQTLHSFAQGLLGRFPIEAGVPPDFRLIEERAAGEALQQAIQNALSAADQESMARFALLSASLNEDGFFDLLSALLQERGRFRTALEHCGGVEGLLTALGQRFQWPVEDADTVLQAACTTGFNLAALGQASESLLSGGKTDRERGTTLHNWLDRPADARVAVWPTYQLAFLTRDGTIRKTLATKQTPDRDAVAAALQAEAERVQSVASQLAAIALRDRMAALFALGASIMEQFQAAKSARAELDFDDLILQTRKLLDRPEIAPWVLYKLDGGLDHVLIDEAQDTNPDQWHIIEAIVTEFFSGQSAHEAREHVGPERSLFAVGDPKQSIYRFQRADPREFVRMQAMMGQKIEASGRDFAPVPLQENYRSTAAVLQAVDVCFAPEHLTRAISLAIEPVHHTAHRAGHAGRVDLWPLVPVPERDEPADWEPPVIPRPEQDAQAILADRIAKTITLWLSGKDHPDAKSGFILPARPRHVQAGDIMILVRRRGPFFDHMIRALKQAGIPVAGADRMKLHEQIAVLDLMALADMALLPEDDLSLATVLKTPLIGLDDDDLISLASARAAGESLWAALQTRAPDAPHHLAALHMLQDIRKLADQRPPYEFFAHILGPMGGRRKIIARLGPEANDPLDEFLSLALSYEQAETPSLQGFLHWIRAGETEIKRDLEEAGDKVRVMTVHGSKGLQAPIVFLPDTTGVPQMRDRILWTEDDPPLPAWVPTKDDAVGDLRPLYDAAKQAMLDEYIRLLYVAMTRAEDRLVVAGWDMKDGVGEEAWYPLIEAGFDALSEVEDTAAPWDAASQIRSFALTGDGIVPGQPDAARIEVQTNPAWLGQPAPPEPEPARPFAPSRPAHGDPARSSPIGDAAAEGLTRGTHIHRLLQSLPELPVGERTGAAARYLAQPGLQLSAEQQKDWAAEALAILETPELADLFSPGSQAEVAVSGRVGRLLVAGQIDRLVVTEDRIIIADYKTNRPPPTKVQAVSPAYLQQMAAYRALLQQIYPEKAIVCALIWTQEARAMTLPDALLDQHTPS